MVRRSFICGALAVAAAALLCPGIGSAAPHPEGAPNQSFAGKINGSSGRPMPAIINVVCPGPIVSTGHPLASQSAEVSKTIPTFSDSGFTGSDGRTISVFFGAPPPTASTIGTISFDRYNSPRPIPTSLNLPCGGSGVVTFLPFPPSSTSRPETPAVQYANIAAAASR
jgi:hypothetical protein